ncbi:MAG: helix-turn-helix transcriptional regulator [Planctomycetota bacterium]|jgi:predicted DNA-binding transcriptional regulator AlpA
MQRYLTKKQVARLLGISTRTVDAWQQRNLLPKPIRVGNRRNTLCGTAGLKRWRLAEIEAFLKSREKGFLKTAPRVRLGVYTQSRAEGA